MKKGSMELKKFRRLLREVRSRRGTLERVPMMIVGSVLGFHREEGEPSVRGEPKQSPTENKGN